MLKRIWSSRMRMPYTAWNSLGKLRAPWAGPPAAWRPLGTSDLLWFSSVISFGMEEVGEEGAWRVCSSWLSHRSCVYCLMGEIKPFIVAEVTLRCLVLIPSSLVLCFRGCFWMGRSCLVLLPYYCFAFLFFAAFFAVGLSLFSSMNESPTTCL